METDTGPQEWRGTARFVRPPTVRSGRRDWLAEDAVGCQPVSNPNSLLNREINREFCRFRRSAAILASSRRANSKTCSEIPYAMEQGILFQRTGEFSRQNRVFDLGPI